MLAVLSSIPGFDSAESNILWFKVIKGICNKNYLPCGLNKEFVQNSINVNKYGERNIVS